MDTTLILIFVALVVIGGIAFMMFQRRRSQRLHERFGPEYDRAVEDLGGRSKAEAELARREKRVEKLHIRPLSLEQREHFVADWQRVQAEFVDDPGRSINHADSLLAEVMTIRGYPMEDFDQLSGDISVDHPQVMEHYREGHEITSKHRRGEANTEELRQAMIHYRALFEELVTDEEPNTRTAESQKSEQPKSENEERR